MRILEGLLCIDVLVGGSERTLEGLGGCWSIWKGPVVVGRSWRVFRDPGGLRLVQKDAVGYTMIKWMVLEEGLGKTVGPGGSLQVWESLDFGALEVGRV